MSDYLKKGARGLLVVFIFSFMGNIAGYLTRAFLARTISPEDFGLFYSVFSLSMFLILLAGFGFGEALPKYIADAMARRLEHKIQRIILFVAMIRVAISVILVAALFWLAPFLARTYYKTDAAIPVLYLFCIIVPILLAARTLYNILQGYQDSFMLGVLGFAEKFFFLIFVVVFAWAGFVMGSVMPAYAFLWGIILTTLLFIPVVVLKVRAHASDGKALGARLRNGMTSFAVAAVLSSIGYLLIGYTDTLMLTYFVDLAQVGIYNTVLPTMLVLSFLSRTVQSVFFPMSAELYAKKMMDRLREGIRLLEKYSLLIAIPVALTTVFYPDVILSVLFGAPYATGAMAMQILSIGLLCYTLGTIYQSALGGIGFPKEVTIIVLISAVFNIVGNLILIPLAGIVGSAMATSASYLIIMGLTHWRLSRRLSTSLAWGFLLKMIFAGAVFAIVVWVAKSAISLNPLIEAVLVVLLGSAAYLLICFALKAITITEIKSLLRAITARPAQQPSAE